MSQFNQINESTVVKSEIISEDHGKNYAEMSAADFIEDGPLIDSEDDGPGMTFGMRKFVLAYLGGSRMDLLDAYGKAGFPAENRPKALRDAKRLLAMPAVQQAIARRFSRHLLNAEWSKLTLVGLANSDMSNFLNGEGKVDMSKAIALGAIGQIKEIKQEYDPDTGNVVKTDLKLYDKIAANAMLLKLHGLLKDGEGSDQQINLQVNIHQMMDRVKSDPEFRAKTGELAELMSPVKRLADDSASNVTEK